MVCQKSFMNFLRRTKTTIHEFVKPRKSEQKLVTSQRQVVINLLEKKDKDKRLISNWRPVSFIKCRL